MNTYSKYCPNVFLAKCEEPYSRGDEITLTTKYGKENISIIHNYMFMKNGFYYYSITRKDGFNTQSRALNKADRLKGYGINAQKRAEIYLEKSDKGKEFLSLGQPILVGHHSEKRHRKLIESNNNNFRKYIGEKEKANEYDERAEYWESRSEDINLSMPESIEYFGFKLEQAKEYHEGLKTGKYKREHDYSLTYAKKEVNELTKKYKIALILWDNSYHGGVKE